MDAINLPTTLNFKNFTYNTKIYRYSFKTRKQYFTRSNTKNTNAK